MTPERPPKDLLVALLPHKSDLAILRDQGWYRIPVKSTPAVWPPRWLAFYQGKPFGPDAYQVQLYGEIDKIETVSRRDLFPNELESARADQRYHRIRLKNLDERHQPIPSHRPRRLLFIPTTWHKFQRATQINDLFDDSPLEDEVWQSFKNIDIHAERQWRLTIDKTNLYLDFAVFCNQGFIDIEADGDTWHLLKDRVRRDNTRNNALAHIGWQVLRFNGQQIREEMAEYCLAEIQKTINTLGGLNDEGLVPRVFYPHPGGSSQQLSLFDAPGPYTPGPFNSGAEWNLES